MPRPLSGEPEARLGRVEIPGPDGGDERVGRGARLAQRRGRLLLLGQHGVKLPGQFLVLRRRRSRRRQQRAQPLGGVERRQRQCHGGCKGGGAGLERGDPTLHAAHAILESVRLAQCLAQPGQQVEHALQLGRRLLGGSPQRAETGGPIGLPRRQLTPTRCLLGLRLGDLPLDGVQPGEDRAPPRLGRARLLDPMLRLVQQRREGGGVTLGAAENFGKAAGPAGVPLGEPPLPRIGQRGVLGGGQRRRSQQQELADFGCGGLHRKTERRDGGSPGRLGIDQCERAAASGASAWARSASVAARRSRAWARRSSIAASSTRRSATPSAAATARP